MFYGMEITRVERPVDGGIRIDTIYKTAKGSLQWQPRFARRLPGGRKEIHTYGKTPQSWSHDFLESGGQSVKRISEHREPKGEGCVSC